MVRELKREDLRESGEGVKKRRGEIREVGELKRGEVRVEGER